MSSITPPRVPSRPTMHVRFFHERNLELLEKAVNEWLAERSDREIAEVRQSVVSDPARAGDREFVVSIWYIED